LLTPVGKIFKPALRWDAVKRVYQAELAVLGDRVHSIEVSATEDKVHGTMATITMQAAAGVFGKEIEDAVEEILARYTVSYRLHSLSTSL
jgi:fatty-acyl-CoA synthase